MVSVTHHLNEFTVLRKVVKANVVSLHEEYEHIPGGELVLTHVVLDYGVLTIEPVFLLQAFEFPLGRVTPLLGSSLVRLEDLADEVV